jgi:diacylglycerol kinase family enzyme
MFLGGLEGTAGYRRLSAAAAKVTASSPVAVHCDGDPSEAACRIDVELRPGALAIVVPAATLDDPAGPFSA